MEVQKGPWEAGLHLGQLLTPRHAAASLDFSTGSGSVDGVPSVPGSPKVYAGHSGIGVIGGTTAMNGFLNTGRNIQDQLPLSANLLNSFYADMLLNGNDSRKSMISSGTVASSVPPEVSSSIPSDETWTTAHQLVVLDKPQPPLASGSVPAPALMPDSQQRTGSTALFTNWDQMHARSEKLGRKNEISELSGSTPNSPASHGGGSVLNAAYTRQALDDLVSKILDEDSNHQQQKQQQQQQQWNIMSASAEAARIAENNRQNRASDAGPHSYNIWACGAADQKKLSCPAAGTTAQWKAVATASSQPQPLSNLPPGLTVPGLSQQRLLQQSSSTPPNAASSPVKRPDTKDLQPAGGCQLGSAVWPRGYERPLTSEGVGTGSGVYQNSLLSTASMTGSINGKINEYQQQQQAHLLAQLQATLQQALQSSNDQRQAQQQAGNIENLYRSHCAAIANSQARASCEQQLRFAAANRKLSDDPRAMPFMVGKEVRMQPSFTMIPQVSTIPAGYTAGEQARPQQPGRILLQGHPVRLSPSVLSLSADGNGVTAVGPGIVPSHAFLQTMCADPHRNPQIGSLARKPAPGGIYLEPGRHFIAAPGSTTAELQQRFGDGMRFDQSQLVIGQPAQGPPVTRCIQPMWQGGNGCASQTEYCVQAPPPPGDQFMGRITPVVVASSTDLFYNPTISASQSMCSLSQMFVGPKTSMPRRLNAANDLYTHLEECFDQLHWLEKEEKHAEAELAQQTPGRIGSSTTSCSMPIIPRLPHNPSRVDRLVVESLREHSKVTSLLGRLWQFRGVQEPLHPSIHSAMETWMEGIRKVQARRKEEIVGTANRNHSGATRVQDNKDILALAAAVTELLSHTRRARTALWCAVLITSGADYIPLQLQNDGESNDQLTAMASLSRTSSFSSTGNWQISGDESCRPAPVSPPINRGTPEKP